MSYPEVLLWQRLRGSPAGIRFRRQQPVGPDYTADFYCSAARLVVEINGQVHAASAVRAYDEGRDRYMRLRGLEVVRVPAADVLRDAEVTASTIVDLAAGRIARGDRPSTTPLVRRGPPPRAGEEQGA